MRFVLALPLALAACVTASSAAEISGADWQLIAQDGARISYPASFSIDASGRVTGKAPCNSYFGQNGASLPALSLAALGSTRMTCPRQGDEDGYLRALSVMTAAEIRGETLVLTGPDDRSLEFSQDPGSKSLICDTCGG